MQNIGVASNAISESLAFVPEPVSRPPKPSIPARLPEMALPYRLCFPRLFLSVRRSVHLAPRKTP
jgi:hypothetical protein